MFNFKVKVTDQTDDNGTKNVEVIAPLKYLVIFVENSWNATNQLQS